MGEGPGYCNKCWCPEQPQGWRCWRARIAYWLIMKWPLLHAEKLMFAVLPYAGQWAYSCACEALPHPPQEERS